ncbi:MAG TPA: secretin N-terminal domain-containing protein, partial [Pirellulaceae bacterium]|nr:secretin N-terminal domain-containing protein [Pirellulaceae bacterium]
MLSTLAPVAGSFAWLAGPTIAGAQDAAGQTARPTQPASPSQPAQPPQAGQQPPAVPGQPPATGAAQLVPGQLAPGQTAPGQPAPGQPPAAQPNLPPEYPPGEAPNIQRPVAPPAPADRAELNVRIDKNGKVRFHFRGQPWPDVLNWLAEISGMSLDWQEMPGDYLNLATQRSYTVAEAHDLINRHLLARGFTLLEDDEVLNVVNLKKLDPALVPRVEPHELLKRRPHEFVKVSFELDSLVAESAVEELKPMLSPNGRLTSLKATNRLEAMDAVVNLRALYKVLGDEQSEEGQERLVREFELEHTKASEVQQQVLALLGVEDRSKTNATLIENMKPEQIQRLMQQQLEASSRDESRRGRGGGPPSILGGKPDVSLVVNPRRNSLLALAPPDKLAVIAQAVKMLDVPRDGVHTIAGSVQRMQAFRLAALDPAAVVKLLEDSGTLEPTTKLQVDEKNKAVVVHGSLADQMAIRAVIEKLDGTGRKFHVFPLRRLEADYVAGTVEFMMGGGGNEEKQQTSRYNPYDPYRSRRETPEPERDKFRVEGDVENNRLLLWANDIEVEEVTNLLVKLGEIPPRRNGETVNGANATRVFSPGIDVDTDALMDQLRRVWPTLAPNPLELPGAGVKQNAPQPSPQSGSPGAAT